MRQLFLISLAAAALAGGFVSAPAAQPGGAGVGLGLPKAVPSFGSLTERGLPGGKRLVLFAGDPSRDLSRLTSRDASGGEISFAAGKGDPPLTLVSFFATCCCSLCGQELVELKGLREKFPSVRIVLVSLDTKVDEEVKAFVAETGLQAPIVHDDVGVIYGAFGTEQVPQTFVLDRRGRILFEARRYGEGTAVPSWTSPQMASLLKTAVAGSFPKFAAGREGLGHEQ